MIVRMSARVVWRALGLSFLLLACTPSNPPSANEPTAAARPSPVEAPTGVMQVSGRITNLDVLEGATEFELSISGGEPLAVDAGGRFRLELPAWRVAAPLIYLQLRGEDISRIGLVWTAALRSSEVEAVFELTLPERGEVMRVAYPAASPAEQQRAAAWEDVNAWASAANQQWRSLGEDDAARLALWAQLAADIEAESDAYRRGLMMAAQFGVGRGDPEAHDEGALQRRGAAEAALVALELDDPRWAIIAYSLPLAAYEAGRDVELGPQLDALIPRHPQPEVAAYITLERYLAAVGEADWDTAEAIWTDWEARPELSETFFGPLVLAYGPTRALAAGKRLPSGQLLDLDDGSELALEGLRPSAPRGVLVVEVWASWCSGCREAMPRVRETLADLRGRGLSVDYVGVDVHDTPEQMRAFLQRQELQVPAGRQTAVAERAERERLQDLVGLSIPNFVLLGPEGRILDSSPTLDANNLGERIEHWTGVFAAESD